MLSQFKNNIETVFSELKSRKLFLAISGGKDSMALSHLLLQCGIKHTLLHCNFKLRGKESDDDELFLADYASKNGLEFHAKQFDTYQISTDQKLSIQECARKLRYDWFRTFIDKDNQSLLLTAHHRDDSIETFFINLFRGTGFRGLSGIPVFANKIIRPLSEFTSEDIYHYLSANQIEYRKDSSNSKKDYLRNKIRHDLIPVLAEMEPQFQSKMGNLFDELTQLKTHLDKEVEKFKTKHERCENEKYFYLLNEIKELDTFFMEQVFRSFGVYRKNVTALFNFLNAATGAQFYTESHQFLVDRDQLIVSKKNSISNDVYEIVAEVPAILNLSGKTISINKKEDFEIEKANTAIQQVDFSKLDFPLTLRNWQTGDKIKPLGMKGSKLISDILIDKKIDRLDKENVLTLLNSDGIIIAIFGVLISEDFKITASTIAVLEINSTSN